MAWGFYLLHQVSFWALIAYAQRTAGRCRPRYSHSLRSANYLALGVNGLFVVLHLVQTHLWYDGLAQDVSIWSALGSVVVMLVWVLLMENPHRGLFFRKRIGFPRRLTEAARRYHGYYFAWAIVYTFWYHPMEATSGHLIGFLYLISPAAAGQPVPDPRACEPVVDARAGGGGARARHAGGDHAGRGHVADVRVRVQRHLRDYADARPGLAAFGRCGLVLAAYVAGVLAVYGPFGWGRLSEVLRIPLIDYAAVFLLAGIIGGVIGLIRLLGGTTQRVNDLSTD